MEQQIYKCSIEIIYWALVLDLLHCKLGPTSKHISVVFSTFQTSHK